MGNYLSCTLAAPMGKHYKLCAKVIFPNGEIRQFEEPIKAAELMLETPNFFLVNTRSLQMGRRFSPLNADEDLDFSNVYVMFPMKRLNSLVTAADMGALFVTAKRSTGRGGAVQRIMPAPRPVDENRADETEGGKTETKLKLEDIEEFSTPEFKHRMSMCRSKKPLLETIFEEPVCAR
ncbi:PADRE domain [Dillenia turbinata]|uniref:PADRE domain n=1 Tax=Dillenia turbinata TaxID=194707 RepID=A0AAN8YUW2_9MAGN